MICKCPQCNGALEYNPGIESMECRFCGNVFVPEEINKDSNSSEDTMECQIYTCTSCAGELVVNDVEMATFCPYCGQPTIVFNRTTRELKPKYILPFSISKEGAVKNIREKFHKGLFVPREVKELKEEQLRGIYIPYFLVDLYYSDKQKLQAIVKKNDISTIKYFYRVAECKFEKVACDASYVLDDEISQQLGPFSMKELKQFEPAYLSGYYADMFDVGQGHVEYIAEKRCETWFDENMRESCAGEGIGKVDIVEKEPKTKVMATAYALLPVWFLTFQYKKEPYTILVNGQTGKVVGSIPFQMKKMILMLIMIFLISCLLFVGTLFFIARIDSNQFLIDGKLYVLCGLVCFIMSFIWTIKTWKKMKKTRNKSLAKFVKERQEKN